MEGAHPSCLLHLQPFGHPWTPGSEEGGGRTTSVCLQSSCDSSVLPAQISPLLQSEPLTAHFLSSKKCKLTCAPGGLSQTADAALSWRPKPSPSSPVQNISGGTHPRQPPGHPHGPPASTLSPPWTQRQPKRGCTFVEELRDRFQAPCMSDGKSQSDSSSGECDF